MGASMPSILWKLVGEISQELLLQSASTLSARITSRSSKECYISREVDGEREVDGTQDMYKT